MKVSVQNCIYIGIDDTDNLHTRGTGFRARQLIEGLENAGLAKGVAVTRHQLLVDERVPYTSHNSSACIVVESKDKAALQSLMDHCREFLREIAAPGSDVGLCLATYEQACVLTQFGVKAQTEVLEQDEARTLALQHAVRLEGLTGDHQGVIGSLAAVGLHVQGNDGRYIWPRLMAEHVAEVLSVAEILNFCGIDKISLVDGSGINDTEAEICIGEWARAVRIDHQAVLLVEAIDGQHRYKVLEKEIIKSIRP